MNASLITIRCPQLDRLNHDLIEAYRALEDREIFAFAVSTESPGNDVSAIHKAMEEHRRGCPICTPVPPDTQHLVRTVYLHR